MHTPTTESVGAALGEFVSGLSFSSLPPEGVRLVERCFIDTVGVMLAGASEAPGEIPAATVGRVTDPKPPAGMSSTLVGQTGYAAPPEAALVNGTAGHALDFDDGSDATSGHPSTVLVPALLAVGEACDASGDDLVTGYVAGFEAMSHLAAPILPDHYAAGWHATGTLGTFGAAAAAANLLGLEEREAEHALNVAASMASGLKRNFGSMTKPLHAGLAARDGVTAALLAAEGFTASRDVLLGEDGFAALYDGGTVDADAFGSPGDRWAIVEDGIHVKRYPCCYFTHTSIASTEQLVAEHGVRPEEVERIHVEVSRGAVDALTYERPETGNEAKFSMHYTVATALVNGEVTLADFEEEALDDEHVDAVRSRVRLDMNEAVQYSAHEATVTIETVDGERYSHTMDEPPGSHRNPLSDGALREKFLACAGHAGGEGDAESLYRLLDSLREHSDLSVVFDQL